MERELEELMAEAFGADTTATMRHALSVHGCDAAALRAALATVEPPSLPGQSVEELRHINAQLDNEFARVGGSTQSNQQSAPHPPARPTKESTSTWMTKKNTFRWVCDLCGTENEIKSAVRFSRRASHEKMDEDALSCKECQFRPKTV